MAKQSESRLQLKIQKALKAEFKKCWVVKFHGGPFSKAGVPDLLCCIRGWFFAFEVKTVKGKVSAIQTSTIEDILKAGGSVAVVTSVREALTLVRSKLEDKS